MTDVLERARRSLGLGHGELWFRYFELGGMSTELQIEAYLCGALEPTTHDRDLIAVVLNEGLSDSGAGQRVPYSDDETGGEQ